MVNLQENSKLDDIIDQIELEKEEFNEADDLETIELPSFQDLKRKTLRDVYGTVDDNNKNSEHDKSPKGFVDEPIRPLVDLLNSHSDFATLSSCSGRIALFDPGDCDDDNNDDNDPNVVEKKNHGKGFGGKWLLVSHSKITHEEFLKALSFNVNNETDRNETENVAERTPRKKKMLLLKLEPMLLHITTRTLKQARVLLEIALSKCGFRESGMIYTKKKITVAIRTHALALSVPLFLYSNSAQNNNKHIVQNNNDLMSSDYIKALVDEANSRLDSNHEQMNHLLKELQNAFPDTLSSPDEIRVRLQKMSNSKQKQKQKLSNSAAADYFQFPSLNLWGHVTIGVNDNNSTGDSELTRIISIGGFGHGPRQEVCDSKTKRVIRRNNVYHLTKDKNGQWSDSWTQLPQGSSSTSITKDIPTTSFPPLQNHAACLLHIKLSENHTTGDNDTHTSIAMICGGRQSPSDKKSSPSMSSIGNCSTNPFLYFYFGWQDNNDCFVKDINIINTPFPSSTSDQRRWGHTFTSLTTQSTALPFSVSSSLTPIAVLIGGRNSHRAFSCFYLLSVKSSSSSCLSDDNVNSKTASESISKFLSKVTFQWERVNIKEKTKMPPLFYHSAVFSPSHPVKNVTGDNHIGGKKEQEMIIFIFGGLSDPLNLLEAFDSQNTDINNGSCSSQQDYSPFLKVVLQKNNVNDPEMSEVQHGQGESYESNSPFDATICKVLLKSSQFLQNKPFASCLSILHLDGNMTKSKDKNNGIIFVNCGGVHTPSSTRSSQKKDENKCQPIQMFKYLKTAKTETLTQLEVKPSWIMNNQPDQQNLESENNMNDSKNIIDLSLMVHHSCIMSPIKRIGEGFGPNYEMLVLGGGYPSFAFGPSFSKCFRIVLSLNETQNKEKIETTSAEKTQKHMTVRKQKVQKSKQKVDIKNPRTCVVYTEAKFAKKVKNLLEDSKYFDKQYRMTTASPSIYVIKPRSPSTDTKHEDDKIEEDVFIPMQHLSEYPEKTKFIAIPVVPTVWKAITIKQKTDSTGSDPNDNESLEPWVSMLYGIGIQQVLYNSVITGKLIQKK